MAYHYRARLAATLTAAERAEREERARAEAALADWIGRHPDPARSEGLLEGRRADIAAGVVQARERALAAAASRFGRCGPRRRVTEYDLDDIAAALDRQTPRHPCRVASRRWSVPVIERVEAATALSRLNNVDRSAARFTVKREGWEIVDVVGVLARPDMLVVATVCDRLGSQGLPLARAPKTPVVCVLCDAMARWQFAGVRDGVPRGWSWWGPFVDWLQRVAAAVPRGPMVHVLLAVCPPRERYAPTQMPPLATSRSAYPVDTSGWTRLDFLQRRLAGDGAGVVLWPPDHDGEQGAPYIAGLLGGLDVLAPRHPRSWAACAAVIGRLRGARTSAVDVVLSRDELVSLWGVPLSALRRVRATKSP